MEDKYSLFRQRSEIWRSLRDGDFEEEEVWDVYKDRADIYVSEVHKTRDKVQSSPLAIPRSLPAAARMIPRTSSGNSSASSSHEAKVLQQSVPLNIPDWSKIYRNQQKKNPKNVSRFDDYDYCHSVADEDDGDGVVNYGGESDNDDDDEEGEDDEYDAKLPPHEFIARRLARSQISSFSVFEGVGRTLKGRDLSKMRNAVLTKTGFLESL
ncbi:protein S40-4-like [Lotus japonicus]|uniref:protein S40-4-like n=1 Tax=Lotus japonicus TaxID=34305 RepID=UPI00258B7263|nr:protein S40-4-like [Lotus japonicus]XP_057428780.1 protein S40-4-like [Lotus japonicus]